MNLFGLLKRSGANKEQGQTSEAEDQNVTGKKIVKPSNIGEKTEKNPTYNYSAYNPGPLSSHLSPFAEEYSAVGKNLRALRRLLDSNKLEVLRVFNREDESLKPLDYEKTNFMIDSICKLEERIEPHMKNLEYTKLGQSIYIKTGGTTWELYHVNKEHWILKEGNKSSPLWVENEGRVISPQYITISPDGRLLILNEDNIASYKDWLKRTSKMTHLWSSREELLKMGITTFSGVIVNSYIQDTTVSGTKTGVQSAVNKTVSS